MAIRSPSCTVSIQAPAARMESHAQPVVHEAEYKTPDSDASPEAGWYQTRFEWLSVAYLDHEIDDPAADGHC